MSRHFATPRSAALPLVLLCFAGPLGAIEIPLGTIVDDLQTAADPAQSYALYLPSKYSADRTWPVIFAFDPRARGRTPVERYQAAAERFGYIVAGSNVSRNGSWEVSMGAAQAMVTDVGRRFYADEKRIYAAGMSGGARVALGLALGSKMFAGVIASSAGYPDSQARSNVPFALFGTAGTEDFNYHEMRVLDRALKSPHRVAIFEGGHVWLAPELAVEAVAWMELQAMKSERRPKDAGLVESIFRDREAALAKLDGLALRDGVEAIAIDFDGLRDVSEFRTRAADLGKRKDVKDAAKKDRDILGREERMIAEIFQHERGIATRDTRAESLAQLRDIMARLAKQSDAPEDSADRRLARRVLRSATMGGAERINDPEYRKLIERYRPAFGGREQRKQ